MTFWWSSLVLVVAVAGVSAQDYYDSIEADLPGDVDQRDTEVIQGAWYGGNGRRGCSTSCPCFGSIRSSYCCPTGMTTCGGRVPVVPRPNDPYSGRIVCTGTLCYRPRRRPVRPAADLCTSRICDVLHPVHASQPLGHTCTSHVDCGDNYCCGHRCATIDACIRAGKYPSAQAPPTSMTASARRCTADVSCNRDGTGHHICCNGQCRAPSSCNPNGVVEMFVNHGSVDY